jgi:hypothetical protein
VTALARSEASEASFTCTLPPRPYPGLRPFEPAEWPVFFGRESMADDVIERILEDRFLVVHGDSGCGKSSLIYAGVLPHLEQEVARGGARWRTCAAMPGERPLWNLARSLAGLDRREHDPERVTELRRVLNFGRDGAAALVELLRLDPNDRVCILVDQFEELFAHAKAHGPHEASLLIELLIGIQTQARQELCAVLTMRSEFLGACAKFPGFAEAVNATQYLLPRMEHADLVRAIREPATLYHGEIDLDLAEHLIADAGGSQDQLPLIQHGLMVLHRDHVLRAGLETAAHWKLTLETCRFGDKGLGQLLSDHADEAARSVAQDRVVEDLFRALTDINADGHAVRRPQTFGQLVAVTGAGEDAVRRIVDAFRADGVSFLRPYGAAPLATDDRVDISHEALIRCWNRIAEPVDGWLIREFKNGLVWRSLLVQADSFERDGSNVLSPATTEERARWLKRRGPAWSERYGGGWDRVQRLIVASIAERDRQKQEEEQERRREEQARLREQELQAKARTARRLRVGLAIVVGLAIAAIVSAGFAWKESREAKEARRLEAEAKTQAERALMQEEEARRKAETESESNRVARERAEEKRKELEQIVADVTRSLEEIQNVTAAPDVDGKLRHEINQAQDDIAYQVARISTVANPPRVYLHISQEPQREVVGQVALQIESTKLGDDSIVVPGIELQPSRANVLRCFRASECADGKRLMDIVNRILASPTLQLEDFSKTSYGEANDIRPRHYEVWFAPGTITLRRPAEVKRAPSESPIPLEAPAAARPLADRPPPRERERRSPRRRLRRPRLRGAIPATEPTRSR